jgi:SAM-dependent methyltransferase
MASNARNYTTGSDDDDSDSFSGSESSGSSSGSFGDWDEADVDAPVTSLLGAHTVPDAASAWAELREATGVDVPGEAAARGWDAYARIRLVNHLRRAAAGAGAGGAAGALRSALAAALAPDAALWGDDALLAPPAMKDDALLMSVVAGEEEGGEGGAAPAEAPVSPPGAGAGGALDAASADALRAELARARAELGRARELLSLLGSDGGPPRRRRRRQGGGGGGDPHVRDGSDNLTYYFNSYASNTGIHRTMLADAPRTEAYRMAIQGPFGPGGRSWVAGRRVLDLGCGTGILSLFAADAGAAAVVALDASSVIDDAARIVSANGKTASIACVFGRAEAVPLHRVMSDAEAAAGGCGGGRRPVGGSGFALLTGALLPEGGDAPERAFDVIVSEWMGYALLYESMLGSVLAARDRHLKPGGQLLPSSASLFLGAVSDHSLWAEKVTWWRAVYGYDMAPMAEHAWPEPLVEELPPGALCSAPPHATLAVLRMATMKQGDQDLRGAPFALALGAGGGAAEMDAEGRIVVHGLAVWFSVGWEADPYAPAGNAEARAPATEEPPELEESGAAAEPPPPPPAALQPAAPPLLTAPHAPPTHWHQTTLLLRTPQRLPPGSTLRGALSMVRDAVNPREYRFAVELEGGYAQKWHMS